MPRLNCSARVAEFGKFLYAASQTIRVKSMNRAILSIFVSLLISFPLSACGRKGPLEAPSASANPAAQSGPAQPAPVEDKPFILDGLIQ